VKSSPPIAIVLACSLAVSCGSSEPESREKDRERPRAAKTSKRAASPGEPADAAPARREVEIPPLAEPLAYFGDLPYERLTAPVEIERQEGAPVILLVADALTARHLGAYGYERDTSPNVDRLAEAGLLLSNYVSNSSWTRPSFTTIVTGLPKSMHHVELNTPPVKAEITTLAERFLEAGYRTAGFVGNPLIRDVWGYDQGFQEWQDVVKMGVEAFPPDETLVDRALAWMDDVGDDPFFLTMFLTSPHPPYTPPRDHRRFLSRAPKGQVIEVPYREYRRPLPKGDRERIIAAYDDEISYMDSEIGRLLEHLEGKGILESAIIAFTADHGEMFGQHNCYLHAYHMWEPALRVPFLLVAPGLQKRGVVDDRPFTHVDAAATLLDLAGIDREDLPGVSIAEALETPAKGRDRVLFSQYNAHGVQRQAIRKGRFKLVHHYKVDPRAEKDLNSLHPGLVRPHPRDLPSLAWDAERYEVYDLAADPGEEKDLFEERRSAPETLELLTELEPHLGDEGEIGELSSELIDALVAAGYIAEERPEKKKRK